MRSKGRYKGCGRDATCDIHTRTQTKSPSNNICLMDIWREGDRATAEINHDTQLLRQNKDVSIESLPNEVLAAIIHDLAIAASAVPICALVCRRWRDVADMYPRGHNIRTPKRRKLCASSVLSMTGSMTSKEIHSLIESIVETPTLAHLLPILVASDRPDLIDCALNLCFDGKRVIDAAETAAWVDAHAQIDARFDSLWPDDVCDRTHLDCNHAPADVRSIASCVLLSVASRHTRAPAVIAAMASLCHADERALRKAISVAATEDRHDTMGALLYLYAQHSGASTVWHESASHMLETLYATVGTWASIECARVIDAFHYCEHTSPLVLMSRLWSDSVCGRQCDAASAVGDENVPRALDKLKDILAHNWPMRTTHWLRAAVVADRPEMLDMYTARAGVDPLPLIFDDAMRAGKLRFCRVIIAAHPEIGPATWATMIDDPFYSGRFTLGGVCWLAAQTWYSPRTDVPARAINCILHNSGPSRAKTAHIGHAVSARNAVDALGVMLARWPTITSASLREQPHHMGPLIVACVLHDKDNSHGLEHGLLGALLGHLERCGIIMATPGSSVASLWSCLIDQMGIDRTLCAREQVGCLVCHSMPMAAVFERLLRRHLGTLPIEHSANNDSKECVVEKLESMPRARVERSLYGHGPVDLDHALLDQALSYLAQNGLLLADN